MIVLLITSTDVKVSSRDPIENFDIDKMKGKQSMVNRPEGKIALVTDGNQV